MVIRTQQLQHSQGIFKIDWSVNNIDVLHRKTGLKQSYEFLMCI